MKVLLVNPNNYQNPPVPPLGLEYLHCTLAAGGHETCILDLCFSNDPQNDLKNIVDEFGPQVAGVTVRNIESAIFRNNIFFLDDIRGVVNSLSKFEIPVILGGAGFSFAPENVLRYLGADWGIKGPGEQALPHLLYLLEKETLAAEKVLDGWKFGIDNKLDFSSRGDFVDYPVYLDKGGIAGFEIQKGCYGRCTYCPESCTGVLFRDPLNVIEEIKSLVSKGVKDFHLCDSEFNQDLEFCHRFLQTLIDARLPINWALYMKSRPYDERLFELLAASGANLVTLSLPTGNDDMADAAQIRRLTGKYDIRLAVDYLCGFPGQTKEEVKADLKHLRKIEPDTVGLNNYIRLYPSIPIAAAALRDKKNLIGETDNNHDLIQPLFYSNISTETLREIAGGDPVFKIEGSERTTNYERIKNLTG